MAWKILFYVFLLFNICHSLNNFNDGTLQEYIRKRREDTSAVLSQLNKNSQDDSQIYLQFLDNNSFTLTQFLANFEAFTLFNKMYAFMNNTLYLVNLEPATSYTIKKILDIGSGKDIVFVKKVEFGNNGIIFTVLSNGSSIVHFYSSVNDKWILVQSIKNADQISDAQFLQNQNSLYLIVGTNHGNSLTKSIIYKWVGSNFDQVNEIISKNVVRVLAFAEEEKQIIAFLEGSKSSESNLVVYQFGEDNVLEKKQVVKNLSAHSMALYNYQNKSYLAVFEETKNSILYHWTGHEFRFWMSFGMYPNISNIITSYYQNYPIVFAVQNKTVISFVHLGSTFEESSRFQLEPNYVKILDMEVILSNNEHKLLFFLSTNSTIDYTATSFAISSKKLDMKDSQPNPLDACVNNLNEDVYKNAIKLNAVIDYVKKKLNPNLLNSDPILQKFPSHLVDNLKLETENQDIINLRNDVSKLKIRRDQIMPKVETLFQDGDTLTGNLVIKNELDGNTLKTINLESIKYFNNVSWNPDSWLSYSKPQNISGPTEIQKLNSNLVALQNDSFYYDIIFKNINFENIFELDSLTADNLNSDKINNIPMDDLYSRKNPVKINGTKSFERLVVEKLKIGQLSSQSKAETVKFLSKLKERNLEIHSNVIIDDLYFDTINDVKWQTFKDSVFRIGKSQHIKGSLRASAIKTNKLTVDSISNINSSLLFTLTTDQQISSNVSFTSFTVRKFDCPTINNLDFSNQVVWKNNAFIKGPVSFDNLIIKRSLKGASGSKLIVDQKDADNLSDMEHLQVYSNVRITGNLHIKDIEIPNLANLLINNKIFTLADIDTYWLKNKNQVISNVIQATKGISTPHLETTRLNNVEVSQYMQNNLENKLPTTLLFKNITVLGNIIINSSMTHLPNLKKIYSEAVKKEGSFNITGHKTLQGDISVGSLVTNYLDGVKVLEALTVNNLDKISVMKEFEKLIIKGNVSSGKLVSNFINQEELSSLNDRVLLKNRSEIIQKMRVGNVAAQFVNISRINGMDYDEYLGFGKAIRELEVLKNVQVHGDVHINNIQDVSSINNFTFNQLLGDKISNNTENVQFNGSIRFLDKVFAEKIEVDLINSINITKLLNRILYRNGDQNITAEYEFDKIITPDIQAPKINEIHTATIIDTNTKEPQTLRVKSRGLQFTSPTFLKSLNSEKLSCNIQEAVNYLQSFPPLSWEKVLVKKNIELRETSGDLYRILHKSFKPNQNNTISTPTTFEHNILANSLNLGWVNGLNFNDFTSDSVLKYEDNQTITGHKVFNSLVLSNGFVYENVDIPKINNFDIKIINRSIVLKDELDGFVIKGHKTFFYGLEANELISSQLSDINANVVSLKNLSTIPSVYFESLAADNLSFNFINDLNISDILKNRILRNSSDQQIASGIYHLDNVEFAGNSHFNHINDVQIEDIVFDVDQQVINGLNVFVQDVVVHQDITLDVINGINITSDYEASIMRDQMVNTSGNIKFNNETSVSKNIYTENINGIPVYHLMELMESHAPMANAKSLSEAMSKNISTLAKYNFEISDEIPSTFLYLEHSKDIQIFLRNVTSARIEKINGDVVLNILHEKLGSLCGFTDDCLCLAQQNIQITEKLSINTIAELNNQVIYSYDDDRMSIHILSYSKGDTKFCYTPNENELITFNWIINIPNKASGPYYTYTDTSKAYIQNVKFFQFEKYVYAVVVKDFNNPNFSNLVCVIYKFDADAGRITKIQEIESGGSLIHLFETVEGVNLILRAAHPHNTSFPVSESEIYKFNESTNLFDLLHKITVPEPEDITSMVVDEKSLIIFAYGRNIEIFEYNPDRDLYIRQIGKTFNSAVIGINVFYIDFEDSDPYLCIVENTGNFNIYSFNDQDVIYSGIIQGLIKLLPFTLNNSRYLFAVSTHVSYVLTIVQQGFY